MPRPDEMPDRGPRNRAKCENCNQDALVLHREVEASKNAARRRWSKCSNCGAKQVSIEHKNGRKPPMIKTSANGCSIWARVSFND